MRAAAVRTALAIHGGGGTVSERVAQATFAAWIGFTGSESLASRIRDPGEFSMSLDLDRIDRHVRSVCREFDVPCS